MKRVIRAVVIGFIVWIVLWVAASQVVLKVFPDQFDPVTKTTNSTGMRLFRVFVSVLVSLVAGFTVAVVARHRIKRAALYLGLVLLAFGLFWEIRWWSLAPAWAHVAFLALLVPAIMYGARLPSALKK